MRLHHILMAVLVAAIWGGNFVVVKLGLKEIPPLFYGAGRFLISALPVFFIKKPPVSWKLIGGISLALGVFKFTFLFMGIYWGVAPGLASLLLQSQAFFTMVFAAYIFKAKILANQVLGMLISFIGIFLIAWQMNAESSFIGFMMIMIASISWGVSNILYRKVGNVDMFALTVWTSVIPPLPMLVGEYFYDGPTVMTEAFFGIGLLGFACLLYTACASTWIGGTLWGILLRTYDPHRVAPFSMLVPLFAMTLSALFLGEEFDQLIMLACCFIFGGLIINQWSFGTSEPQTKQINTSLEEGGPLLSPINTKKKDVA